MKQLTKNKPKALVPVQNLPMLFHLFRKYPDRHFIVIGDYKYDVLRRYLEAFAQVDYETMDAGGRQGTCAGIGAALTRIPQGEAFMLIWSDLILPEAFKMPERAADYVGISKDFLCRWSYRNGIFREYPEEQLGVAGLFLFQNSGVIADVPQEGEFVKWLGEKNIPFQELPLYQTKEYGLLSEYEKLRPERCRPFNRLIVEGNRIRKEGIDEQGRTLAARECAWYERLTEKGFSNIPVIYSLQPLIMEKIEGKNIYEYTQLSFAEKENILCQIAECLHGVHRSESVPADRDSYFEAYIGKTFDRLKKIQNLVPFARDPVITVNGRRCRNVFYERKKLEKRVGAYMPETFHLIHGDCTFSNILLKEDQIPVLIDPRGYFGRTLLYGDSAYDWVKLYYSIVGNYDQFNLKRFELDIGEHEVHLKIASSGWEDMEQTFLKLLDGEADRTQLQLLHAIVWLSLTTYAWEDYDSVCGAFYNGLYYLEEVL